MSTLSAADTRLTTGFQPEIQGLRTLAVALVVLYHFWPWHLSGGFVGVDIFFVISGYLITSHLYREIVREGHVNLGKFWARRIRRLLPLSFLVLILTSIAAVILLPATLWQATYRQVMGSAFYVQNWLLASDAVDYSAQDDAATAVQHFWTLSVEEQFYVLWPLLLFIVYWLVSRRGRPSPDRLRRVMITALALLGLASLVFSIAFTAYDPAQAYFVTPTRIWEFVAGAVVALALMGRQYHGRLANLIGWAGFAAIVISGVLYSAATPFPGYTALLPVLGTVALLACGGRERFSGIYWWLSRRPATVGGDLSYAIYLWHWPVVLLAPYAWEAAETWQGKIVLIAGVVLLSWASKITVEDPWRRSRLLASSPRTYTMAASGMAFITVLALLMPTGASAVRQSDAVSTASACYGYQAMLNPEECDPLAGDKDPNPAVEVVAQQAKEPAFPDCQAEMDAEGLPDCRLGVDRESADKVMAVFGDSHGTQWLPALNSMAHKENIALEVYTRSGCTPNVADLAAEADGRDQELNELCTESNRQIVDKIAGDDSIDVVVVGANQTDRDYVNGAGQDFEDPTKEGFIEPWSTWMARGKDVVVLGEIPRLEQGEVDGPTCVAENPDDVELCSLSEEKSFPRTQNLRAAAEGIDDERFHFIETKDFFCRDDSCHALIGGIVTYYDKSHISHTYAENLAPEIAKRFKESGVL
ncbi:acyltransferase family protein [Zhihengliuella halotolerans]|uniref:Peptidoglycan/LPS O-acetylase OafA/YrhL n=1 Tax=Zhihengliuella halotolerans TaxID=370736 RepID=A0A4Q8ACT5_9MICC|nr:acyltransferase family protein [Zhihengliuella halotolerans]RZU61551.1 peptidoglycan/LPS O-acetylase OafA/YrhL [Zhihengliuella halotolerans]